MSVDHGVFSQVVPAAGALISAATALLLTWKGRGDWEPAEEDIPRAAQKVGGLITALAIAGIWYWFTVRNPGSGGTLLGLIAALGLLALLCLGLYGYLVGVLTFKEMVRVTGANQPVERKVIGGFRLTKDADATLKRDKLTVQKLFAGAEYDEDSVWTRPSRALAKLSFQFAYIGLISTATSALTSAVILVTSTVGGADLTQATERWIAEAEKAREAKTVSAGQLSTTLVAARSAFESAWHNAGLDARRKLDQEQLAKAISYVTRTYRMQEQDSPTQKNALAWADAAIQHFGQTQDRRLLTEALLDKGAVHLDLAQLANNNKGDFQKHSDVGDALIARATEIADAGQRPQVLRFASRFYYNLARPKSYRLSDDWDNNYLLLARDKALAARQGAPEDIKNTNQLLRVTIKAARNPPQDTDNAWTAHLREAKDAMKKAWGANQGRLVRRDERLSSLSVLGTGTLEVVAREWSELDATARATRATQLLEELDADGIGMLREATALLETVELRRSHGFDLYYDVARAHAQRTVILRLVDAKRAKAAFEDVVANLRTARENATAMQADAALADIGRDPSFMQMESEERSRLSEMLHLKG